MSKKKPELFLSIDIETDGPSPGLNNMLTFGVVAFSGIGEILDKFYRRIIPLPDLQSNPDTMIWWREQDNSAYYEAFDCNPPGVLTSSYTGQRRVTAYDAMLGFAAWLNYLATRTETNNYVAMAWPAVFDFPFINYYSYRFLRKNPLGYDCLDMRSYIMGLLRKRNYREIREEEIDSLFGSIDILLPSGIHDHVSIDDAMRQGILFFNILNSPRASETLIKYES